MNPKQQEENNNKPSPLLSLKLRVCPPRASQEAHSTKQPYDQTQPDQSHPPAQFNGDAVSNGNTKSIRLLGPTPEDITTLHPDQSHWNIDNLPSVLYALRPGSQYVKSRARVRTTEFEIFGKHVREFHSLPRQISFKVEGWRVEAWWRLDRRIEAQDLLDRINPKFGITMLDLEMRREQFRRSFCVADWKSQSSINEVTRLVKMAGIDPILNTTRGLTPGLIDPPRGEDGGRIPAPAGKEKFVDFSGSKPFFVISGLQQHAAPKPVSIPSSPNQRKAISSPLSERVQLPVYTLAPPLIQKRKTEDWTRPTSPLQKKKQYTAQVSTASGSYPEAQCELASHQGTPIFRETGHENSTMSLEEYLDRNHMSFEEYLCRDEKEDSDGRKGFKDRERRAQNRTTVTTPSKGNAIDPWLSVL